MGINRYSSSRRTHYSDYTNHCMRIYVSSNEPDFDNSTDNKNWRAANEALKSFSREEQALLKAVYRHQLLTLPDAVSIVASEHNVRKQDIWQLLGKLQRKIAWLRGLL